MSLNPKNADKYVNFTDHFTIYLHIQMPHCKP